MRCRWYQGNHGTQIEHPGKSEMNKQYLCIWTTKISSLEIRQLQSSYQTRDVWDNMLLISLFRKTRNF